jgi:TP901 family phage tail tape measure protein
MASSAQTLTTNIVINAKTGNGFSQVGATLTELGSLVNGMSQELINFGQESIEVYRGYEKSMRDAEVALSTRYGQGTQELAGYMSQLDTAATEWAATTIFHTDDVANAISEAAHAGWDFDQIMSGIPAAMQLAQAGSLDLSEAVNYIVKSTSAMGVEFGKNGEGVQKWIDLWTFAANSSASTVGEFGDAMLRMGSTMRFVANPEELMTLIAITANAGQTGQEAGTLIRNSMMRLVAPTKKAKDAMAELGASSEEMAEVITDENLIAANKRLEEYGFSAFDAKSGELKNVLDIYRELYMALGEIAGGYDKIDKSDDALGILASIFPTRTITEALTLLRGAAEGYDGLYDSMKAGAAEGYGAYAAATMMDTLDGRIETFNSKVERLKQLVGESLSGQVGDVLGSLGGFIDQLAGLDDGVFDGLVNALEVFAAAGPGLLTAGGAFRLLGILLSNPAMGIGALTMAAIAVERFAETMHDAAIEDAFGNLELGDAALDGIRQLSSEYETAYKSVHDFQDAVEQSLNAYQTASSSLSGSLIENFLSGAKLSSKDQEDLLGLGDQMHTALVEGIEASRGASDSYWTLLFGGEGEELTDILDINESAYQDAIEEANNLSEQLKDALTSAFEDGHVDGDELAKIQQYMREYNDAVAKAAADAANEEAQIQMQKLLNQGQGASLESLTEISRQMREVRDGILAQMDEDFQNEYAKLQVRGADEATLKGARKRYDAEVAQTRAGYDQKIRELWDMGLSQSEYGDAYKSLQELSSQVTSGQMDVSAARELFNQQFGGVDWGRTGARTALSDLLPQMMSGLGSESSDLQLMREILSNETGYNRSVTASDRGGSVEAIQMPEEYTIDANVVPHIDQSSIDPTALAPIPVQIEPRMDNISMDPAEALQSQGVDVQVDGDTTQLQATIQAEDGQNLTQYIDGDATNLHYTIMAEDGQVLTENVHGNISSLRSAIDSQAGRTITVNVRANQMFATGGRATTASIFGEAGPEWAIPEEHSERTASLLDAARQASGFTWPELIARNGGLNAGNGGGSQTLVYSPTINAGNAEGVEEVLKNDKDRLEGWYRDMKMRDSAEVYA